MKKFLFTLLVFFVPVLVITVIIATIPVDRKYAYSFINKGGCEARSSWIYRNIYEDTSRIDVAFIGTSHTMNGVDDEQIEKQYNDSAGQKLYFKNLSYCRLGRNFDYVVVRDLLQHKKVKAIVLEIREEESQYGHPSFANVATVQDLFTAPMEFNQTYIRDIYNAFLLRLQYLREMTTGEYIRHEVDVPATQYGYNGTDHIADRNELYKKKRRKDINIPFIERGLNAYPMKYVDLISRLARENKATVIFIYLPKFGYATPSKEMVEKYATYGKVIVPPMNILSDANNWSDQEHLNKTAADSLAKFVAAELKKDL